MLVFSVVCPSEISSRPETAAVGCRINKIKLYDVCTVLERRDMSLSLTVSHFLLINGLNGICTAQSQELY